MLVTDSGRHSRGAGGGLSGSRAVVYCSRRISTSSSSRSRRREGVGAGGGGGGGGGSSRCK